MVFDGLLKTEKLFLIGKTKRKRKKQREIVKKNWKKHREADEICENLGKHKIEALKVEDDRRMMKGNVEIVENQGNRLKNAS